MKFANELMSKCMADAAILAAMHWKETEGYRASHGYCPDPTQYRQMEADGSFAYFTARDDDGNLVGHIGFIIHKSRHTSKMEALEDFFYFKPESRKGMNAVKFIRFCIDLLKSTGINSIGMTSKLANDIDPLLRRVGFVKVSHFYMLEK